MLIFFDVLLALVLALVIYSVAARDRHAPRGLFDLLQLLLVVAALLVDLLVLGAVVGRLSDFGATPNRIRRPGREPGAAGESGLVGLALSRLLARSPPVLDA